MQEIESTSLRLPQTSLNPHAPVFTSQNSPTSKEIGSDQPDEPPALMVKATSGVDQPLVQTGDHVIIDVPDCDTHDSSRDIPSAHCENDTSLPDQRLSLVPLVCQDGLNDIPLHQLAEPRRSNRERRAPHKLTYDELGTPLILALSSFFGSLQNAIASVSSSPHQASCRV